MQGKCPQCKSEDIYYGERESQGERIGYRFECKNCKAEGIEWYNLDYTESILNEKELEQVEFKSFPKISRISRECVITEKIDGTNALICITEDGQFLVGSSTRWITPEKDNHGFARWAYENKEELMKLGHGFHYGEWWGSGIQRNYGLKEKRFSLFNTARWSDNEVRPKCCHVVPVLYTGMFETIVIDATLYQLKITGSKVVPGFMKPEGIVIYLTQARFMFKKTIEGDEKPKALSKEELLKTKD